MKNITLKYIFLFVLFSFLYERYFGKVLSFLNYPIILHTRTNEAIVMKYLPLIIFSYVFFKIHEKYVLKNNI